MELDYYKLYLQNYLREHSFDDRDLMSQIVVDNADAAATEFTESRKSGYSIDGSSELAMCILFKGIGISRREAAEDFLETNFDEEVSYNGMESFNEWADKLAREDSVWKKWKIESGLGLDESLLETNKYEIIGEIVQFLKDHGL